VCSGSYQPNGPRLGNIANMNQTVLQEEKGNFGLAWLLLCLAFGSHIWDEAAHGFLEYYNATVLTLWAHFSFFPKIDMDFRPWLLTSAGIAVVLLLLTPFAYRNARWLRPLAYLFGVAQLLNGLAHIVFTILGHTVPSVVFHGPAPGIYSAPLLLAFSLFLYWRLRKSAPRNAT
jgi:hypothetical protein